jgi:NAD(P)-dependent dehydrogenase (short-subunit alcohol dehydrogenase family)
VAHLLAVECRTNPEADRIDIDRANLYGCVTLLHTIQGIARYEWTAAPKLWVVTRNAQPIAGDRSGLNVFQSPLWGMAKVAGQTEHRDIWGAIVDLDADENDQDAAQLADEFLAPGREDQVGFRAGIRYVPRLKACPEVKLPTLPAFRTDVSYLITGGLGALGVAVANWIVKRGGRHIILTSRDGIPPREQWSKLDPAGAAAQRVASVRQLERSGAHVRVIAADVSEEADVDALISANEEQGYPPIRGIIHAAGTAVPKLLVNMDAAEMTRVLKPKVNGAWFLHKKFSGQPLDFFILFSSIASVVVSTGQGNYSAGNAFLDAVAHWRHATGKPGLSVNWGPWGEIGLAAELDLIRYFESRGFYAMTTGQGLEALGQLFGERTPQSVVIAANWKVAAEVGFNGNPPALLDTVLAASAEESSANSHESDNGATFLTRYTAEPDANARRALLEWHLTDLACRVLRIDPAKLATGDSLNSRGMDSMMAIELKNRIEQTTRLNLAIVELLRGASVIDLANRLQAELDSQVNTELDEEIAAILRDAGELAEDEVAALLDEETATEQYQ